MAYQVKDKSGEVVKRDNKEIFGLDYLGVVKGVNLEQRTLRILATDETRDRDGDIITMKGWQLDNYIKNPVFLWSHDYNSVPIGAAIKIEKKRSPHRLILTHKFPTQGVHPFADMILQLYHEKVVNAGSVGFIPYDWEEIKDDNDEEKFFFGPRKFIKQELLEHSGCAVPANPNALQDSVSRAMKSLDIKYDDKTKLYKVVTGSDILQLDDEVKERASAEINEVIEKGPQYEEETKVQIQVPEDIEKEEEFCETEGCINEMPEGTVVIYPSGVINSVHDDCIAEYKYEDNDAFRGLKNLIDEILDKHIADSLEDEKNIYRKRADMLLKIGAVLNKKNKKLLKQASDNILEVLESAEQEETEEAVADQEVPSERSNDSSENRFDVILSGDKAKAGASNVARAKKESKTQKQKMLAEVNNSLIEANKLFKKIKGT